MRCAGREQKEVARASKLLTTVGVATLLELGGDGTRSGHDGGDEGAEDNGELHLE